MFSSCIQYRSFVIARLHMLFKKTKLSSLHIRWSIVNLMIWYTLVIFAVLNASATICRSKKCNVACVPNSRTSGSWTYIIMSNYKNNCYFVKIICFHRFLNNWKVDFLNKICPPHFLKVWSNVIKSSLEIYLKACFLWPSTSAYW